MMPQDLTGDPVYDVLKSWVTKGFEITGGIIVENKACGPHTPRKTITMFAKETATGKTYQTTYNYNRIANQLGVVQHVR